jgi:cytoplasmic iron level regulating protein YaaA (DUF328/UPF0246 family)
MLVVISPAKKLDMDAVEGVTPTQPMFPDRATELAKVAGKLKVKDLQNLMHISENLAKLNADRFKDFGQMDRKAAALAFAGDTYQGLEATTLDPDDMAYAQDHLRILSGLYGVLRPLDEIEPYRLEMGSRLKTKRGKSLYDYWGDTLSQALNAQAEAVDTDVLVNCASQEYFGAVDLTALDARVITPVFMEDKGQGPKIVSFFAKKARGAMARFMIQNRVTSVEGLRDFDIGGYSYQPRESTDDKLVFTRPYPEAA